MKRSAGIACDDVFMYGQYVPQPLGSKVSFPCEQLHLYELQIMNSLKNHYSREKKNNIWQYVLGV